MLSGAQHTETFEWLFPLGKGVKALLNLRLLNPRMTGKVFSGLIGRSLSAQRAILCYTEDEAVTSDFIHWELFSIFNAESGPWSRLVLLRKLCQCIR